MLYQSIYPKKLYYYGPIVYLSWGVKDNKKWSCKKVLLKVVTKNSKITRWSDKDYSFHERGKTTSYFFARENWANEITHDSNEAFKE